MAYSIGVSRRRRASDRPHSRTRRTRTISVRLCGLRVRLRLTAGLKTVVCTRGPHLFLSFATTGTGTRGTGGTGTGTGAGTGPVPVPVAVPVVPAPAGPCQRAALVEEQEAVVCGCVCVCIGWKAVRRQVAPHA
jgi:hypothetical protein